MDQLIQLYIMKLQTGEITKGQIEFYDELIELYMDRMKQRLQGSNDDNWEEKGWQQAGKDLQTKGF